MLNCQKSQTAPHVLFFFFKIVSGFNYKTILKVCVHSTGAKCHLTSGFDPITALLPRQPDIQIWNLPVSLTAEVQ